jgi:hypothetical protein
MSRYFIFIFGLFFGLTACGEKPPVDWMYREYKSLHAVCPESGQKIERKSSTASLTYTWSCSYPEDFERWLSGFEENHLSLRGWSKSKTPSAHTWHTYCNSQKKVVMRVVKAEAKKAGNDDRLWISIRFPGSECS